MQWEKGIKIKIKGLTLASKDLHQARGVCHALHMSVPASQAYGASVGTTTRSLQSTAAGRFPFAQPGDNYSDVFGFFLALLKFY